MKKHHLLLPLLIFFTYPLLAGLGQQDTVTKNNTIAIKNITFTPYGFVNVSAVYENQKTTPGDFAIYALSPDMEDNDAFYLDPRSSRFGVCINAPGIKAWENSAVKAVFEVDFQGAYSLRTKSALLFRKAFVEVGTPKLRLMAGQDWEVISPLYPSSLNYAAASAAGNIGYRKTMLRYAQDIPLSSKTALLIQCAAVDNVLRDGIGYQGITPTLASFPVGEARMAFAWDMLEVNNKLVLGVSGHYGQQRFDVTAESKKQIFDTWSLNLDLNLPLGKKFLLQGECFVGANLSSFDGGILQGVDLLGMNTIGDRGGWVNLNYTPKNNIKFNLGYTVDDPSDKDLTGGVSPAKGGVYISRTYNQSVYANANYFWNKQLMTGVEVSNWQTDWQQYKPATETTPAEITSMAAGNSWRAELVVRYTF